LYVERSRILLQTIELYGVRLYAVLIKISETVKVLANLIHGHCGVTIKVRAQIASLRNLAHAIYVPILDAYCAILWQIAEVVATTDTLRASQVRIEDHIRILACQHGDRGAHKARKLC
jgi:hypothetical protein